MDTANFQQNSEGQMEISYRVVIILVLPLKFFEMEVF